MYAFILDGAVWRTATGGTAAASWTSRYSAQPVKRGCVDWRSAEPVVYVQLNRSVSSGATLVRSTGAAGTNYQPPSSVTGGYGWAAGDDYHNKSLSKSTNRPGFEAIISPAASVYVINAVGRIKRSENSGDAFVNSSIGFSGMNNAAYTPSALAQRADNMDCTAIPVQDTNLLITTDGFRSIEVRPVPFDTTVFGFPAMGVKSSYCVEWLPADSQNLNGVILIGLGNADRQGVCRSTDLGMTWTAITSAASALVRHIKGHPTSTGVDLEGRWQPRQHRQGRHVPHRDQRHRDRRLEGRHPLRHEGRQHRDLAVDGLGSARPRRPGADLHPVLSGAEVREVFLPRVARSRLPCGGKHRLVRGPGQGF